jgi:exosortase
MNPLPKRVRDTLAPSIQPLTTWCAMSIDRAAGYPITADGHVLRMPNESLNVVSGCSGLQAIARLWVLAALVVALFETSARQKIALFASAILIGFLVNAARIAVLAVAVLRGENTMFDYWHVGLGATLFTLASTTVACLAWWQIFRRGRPPPPEGGAPCLVH